MKILITEDETVAYENLVEILLEIDPAITILGNTESVAQTVKWLQTNTPPDLILMDIHLSDGSAFAIFDKIKVETPIIFTTAYDKYAIEAFRFNSIDYLLKPIKVDDMRRALNKFERLTHTEVLQYLSQIATLTPVKRYIDRILVQVKDKLLPISLNEVSCFYTTNKNTTVYLSNGAAYLYPRTLDQIMASINPDDFIRANKQYIIARKSVKDITIWFDNRLLVSLDIEIPERMYISKNKASEFKEWVIRSYS